MHRNVDSRAQVTPCEGIAGRICLDWRNLGWNWWNLTKRYASWTLGVVSSIRFTNGHAQIIALSVGLHKMPENILWEYFATPPILSDKVLCILQSANASAPVFLCPKYQDIGLATDSQLAASTEYAWNKEEGKGTFVFVVSGFIFSIIVWTIMCVGQCFIG